MRLTPSLQPPNTKLTLLEIANSASGVSGVRHRVNCAKALATLASKSQHSIFGTSRHVPKIKDSKLSSGILSDASGGVLDPKRE